MISRVGITRNMKLQIHNFEKFFVLCQEFMSEFYSVYSCAIYYQGSPHYIMGSGVDEEFLTQKYLHPKNTLQSLSNAILGEEKYLRYITTCEGPHHDRLYTSVVDITEIASDCISSEQASDMKCSPQLFGDTVSFYYGKGIHTKKVESEVLAARDALKIMKDIGTESARQHSLNCLFDQKYNVRVFNELYMVLYKSNPVLTFVECKTGYLGRLVTPYGIVESCSQSKKKARESVAKKFYDRAKKSIQVDKGRPFIKIEIVKGDFSPYGSLTLENAQSVVSAWCKDYQVTFPFICVDTDVGKYLCASDVSQFMRKLGVQFSFLQDYADRRVHAFYKKTMDVESILVTGCGCSQRDMKKDFYYNVATMAIDNGFLGFDIQYVQQIFSLNSYFSCVEICEYLTSKLGVTVGKGFGTTKFLLGGVTLEVKGDAHVAEELSMFLGVQLILAMCYKPEKDSCCEGESIVYMSPDAIKL